MKLLSRSTHTVSILGRKAKRFIRVYMSPKVIIRLHTQITWNISMRHTEKPAVHKNSRARIQQLDFPVVPVFVCFFTVCLTSQYFLKNVIYWTVSDAQTGNKQHAIFCPKSLSSKLFSCEGKTHPPTQHSHTHVGLQPGQSACEISPLSDVGYFSVSGLWW